MSNYICITELTTERPTTTDKKSSAFPKSSTTTPNDQLHSTTISSKQTANGKIVNPPITNKYTEATDINSETAEKYGTNGTYFYNTEKCPVTDMNIFYTSHFNP